jgi:hypothetical protein
LVDDAWNGLSLKAPEFEHNRFERGQLAREFTHGRVGTFGTHCGFGRKMLRHFQREFPSGSSGEPMAKAIDNPLYFLPVDEVTTRQLLLALQEY